MLYFFVVNPVEENKQVGGMLQRRQTRRYSRTALSLAAGADAAMVVCPQLK